jgi:PilZ domain-containing protein
MQPYMNEPQNLRPIPRAPRYPVRIPLRYRTSGAADWVEGRTENISRSGVLFRTDLTAPLHTAIEMLMTLPAEVGGTHDGTVICRGRIVRSEPPTPLDPRPALAATIAGYRLAHMHDGDPRRI